ncbi:MAG TPA: efflux RND transporter permease subunit [Candidatus Obscuribacterales bacterium]
MIRYTKTLSSQARAVELFFILFAVAGIFSYLTLPSDVYPELSFPRIEVIAHVGDMAPERVVVSTTRPLELAVGQVYNVRWVRSKTIRGAAEIAVDFQEGTNMQLALQQLQAKVAEVRNSLPSSVDLTIERVTPAIFPVITYNISSDTLTEADLTYIATYEVQPAITRVPGVSRCIVQGGITKEVVVQVDPARISALKLSLNQIASALQSANQSLVLGRLNREYQQNLVVAPDQAVDAAQLNNFVIASSPNGDPVYLHNVGNATWGTADRTQIVSVNGKPGVAINVFRQPNSNVVAVSDGVKAEFDKLKKSLPAGLNISPAYDESRLVVEAIENVRDAILAGILMIVVVLFLFLRDWRSTVIAGITIPLSALAAFAVMKLVGQTLNLMSLGGLAVAIGLVIDDAVVVIENIDHQLRNGLPPHEACAQALSELTVPVLSSTATTVVVFVPLGLLSGVAGQFFTSFTITLTAAVVFSFLLSMTLTPLLSYRWLKPKDAEHSHEPLAKITHVYPRLLKRTFARPIIPATVAVVLLVVGLIMGLHLGTDFLPAVDEGSYMLDYLAPPGSSLQETDSVARVLEQILAKTPEVVAWTRRTGAESGLYATQPNKGDIQVVLKPSNQRHRTIWQIMDAQREQANALLPEADIDFHQILQDELNDLQGIDTAVAVKVFGQNPDVLRSLADRVNDLISGIPGLKDLIVSGKVGAPQTDIVVNPAESGRLGLTPADALAQVHDALIGGVSTQIRQGDRLIDVRVRLDDAFRSKPEDIAQIPIIGTQGKMLPLGAIARISQAAGEGQITRENLQRYVSVGGDTEGRDLGSIIHDVQTKIAHLVLPTGYTVDLGGTYVSQQQAFGQLVTILLLGILIVYFVLIVQFRSWAQPLAIFTAIPLSLFGVVLALIVTGTTFNVSSFMGAILLVGLVVKNGIIFIDCTNRNLAAGETVENALIEAGRVRIRPILMTTLCTLLGLLPLALGFGAGAELQKPLAIAVIGGLSLSTFFTLIFMPVVFRALRRERHKVRRHVRPRTSASI